MIENFVPKAWRRAVAASELEVFLTPLEGKEGRPLVASLKRELKAALMSPRFLYRGLLVEGKPGEQSPVDSFELAERLSYFLWADMPDDDLSILAENGTIDISDLPQNIRLSEHVADDESTDCHNSLKSQLRNYEQAIIKAAIDEAKGDRKIAANRLGIGVSSLYRKLDTPIEH